MRILFFLSMILLSCGEEPIEIPKEDPKWTQDQSSDLNKGFAEREEADIEGYLKQRPDWEMIETGTGLRYMIYQEGDGEQAQGGYHALVNFTISLLDGTMCYTSDSTGPESFLIEHSEIESGLHEGIKYMKIGDRAKMILPSPIAHGLIGDNDKIPPLEPVVYDIELLALKNPNE